MTNKEFLVELQNSCHIEMAQCLMLLGSLQRVLGKAGEDLVPVELPGIGVFASHKHPEYVQEDPKTGAMTMYPPRISYRMQSEFFSDSVSASSLLCEFAKVPEDDATDFLNALISVIKSALEKGEELEVPGIGVFNQVLTHNSEVQHIGFVPNDQLKELVNAPFNCFEPMIISEGKPVVKAEPVPVAEVETETEVESEIEVETETEIESVVEEKEEVKEEVAPVQEPEPEPEPETEVEPEVKDIPEPAPVIVPEEKETPKPEEEPAQAKPAYVRKDDGEIEIKQVNILKADAENSDEDEKSNTKLLYISISLILLCCGFIIWQIFGKNDEPTDAVVVSQAEITSVAAASEEDVPAAEPDSAVVVEQDSIVEEPTSAETEEIAPEPVKEVDPTPAKVEEPAKPAPAKAAEPAKPVPTKVEEPAKPKDFHRMIGADGNPVTVTLQAGDRLTLIALEHFGDKAFWPYIFDANSDKLKAPNLVNAGMKLYLPDPKYYGIDANDPASLQKAKNRGAQLLK